MKHLMRLLILLCLLVPATATPTSQQARDFVYQIAEWSLQKNKLPVNWDVVQQHSADFEPELYKLMEWVSTPHKDIEGREWHYGVDPIWQVQSSSVTQIKVGAPKPDKDTMLVVVDYISPSAISPSRPSTKFHNVWVIAEHQGRPVLKDIRFHIKAPAQTMDGSLVADLKKAKAGFRAPK